MTTRAEVNRKYVEKLTLEGYTYNYRFWIPNDPEFKAKLKAHRDRAIKQFEKTHRFDKRRKKWVEKS